MNLSLTPDHARSILHGIDRARLSEHRPAYIYADEAARKAMLRFFNDSLYRTDENPKVEKPTTVFGLPIIAWEELDDLALIRADGEQQEGRAIVVVTGRVFCKRTFS